MRSPWLTIVLVCLVIAFLSAVTNITVQAEIEGELQLYSGIRRTLAELLNSGTVWAGTTIWAGWILCKSRFWVAAIGGIVAGELMLFAHYLFAALLNTVFPSWNLSELSENWNWVVATLVLCGPLGLIGWFSARPGRLAFLCRFAIPAGAILEPYYRGQFAFLGRQSRPEAYANAISGLVLIVFGITLAVVIAKRGLSSSVAQDLEPIEPSG